jgi:hypothetical protein
MPMSFNDELDRLRFPLELLPLDEDSKQDCKTIRKAFNELAHLVVGTTEVNRAQMLCLTALQEARMWAVQAVVDEAVTDDEDGEDVGQW